MLDNEQEVPTLDQSWRDKYPEREAADVPTPAKTSGDESLAGNPVESGTATASASPRADADNTDSHFALVLRDGNDQAIQGLEVQVTTPDGAITAKSSAQGVVAVPLPATKTGTAEVKVKDQTGAHQPVCKLDLAKCQGAVIIRSPKVATQIVLRPHQQTPPPAAPGKAASPKTDEAATQSGKAPAAGPWWKQNGALQIAWKWLGAKLATGPVEQASSKPLAAQTLNTAGQPVSVVVGSECPNKDNLRLGQNNIYRKAILDASKRLGMIPQALCALIECEAAKKMIVVPLLDPKTNQQIKDKKGIPQEKKLGMQWDEHSGGAQDKISGMTQFMRETWLGLVMKPGTYLHTQAKAKNWVRQEDVRKKGKQWVFVLEKGTTTEPKLHLNDSNVRACLAMRLDHTWAINAAADYGIENLGILAKEGFKTSGLPDMDKAKLMYLMHHEGCPDGPRFIKNTLAPTDEAKKKLKGKFAAQFKTKTSSGVEEAERRIRQAGGDVEIAYRSWLARYVDDRFASAERNAFCCNPMQSGRTNDLLLKIGGVKVVVV
ncbi:hypothetical protein [Viridibacterium curvum]|uniref:Uncharacterized protein n=1 Tax=Viridibacterium curvum TaxID=1101404 RepID=A0ABP9R7F3_9RHOO